MTDQQWHNLLRVVEGEQVEPLPVGAIIDCPWLPGWAGMSILDYLTDDRLWLAANLEAVRRFPAMWFLPGFWAEYGMCTEPAAFGARCVWPENEFPFARRVLHDYSEIDRLARPDCRSEGMCPFVIRRLLRCREAIEAAGHRIRMAASRGPMNIATYLLGHTETMIGIRTEPRAVHRLLAIVTEFVAEWIAYQREMLPSIQGLLILDDLIGFLGERDFREFVVPCFQQIAAAVDVPVKMLHNDCHGLVTARHLGQMGFNVFNFSFEHSLAEMREAAGPEVVLVGNVPPRDVMAAGTPEDVARAAEDALQPLADRRRLILSCGGGMPPGVTAENIDALVAAAGRGWPIEAGE